VDTTKMLACLGAFAASFALPNVGRTADNCTGQWVQVGTTVVSFNDNRNAPQHMAIGVWDAKTFHIIYKDTEGDTYTSEVSSGGAAWKTISGTGKYANAKGSGWSRTLRTEVADQGGVLIPVYIGDWGGNCSTR